MRLLLLAAGLLSLAAAAALGADAGFGLQSEDRSSMSRLQRLAGPLGSAAASVQWMRFTLTVHSGDGTRALAMGQSALAMDPLAPDGWQLLAHHLAFERGSSIEAAKEGDRRAWIEAGLDLLEEGAEVSRFPGVLLYDMALVALFFGTLPEEDRPWPGCQEELVARAIAGFRGAVAAGHSAGPRALADALEMAQQLGIATENRGENPGR